MASRTVPDSHVNSIRGQNPLAVDPEVLVSDVNDLKDRVNILGATITAVTRSSSCFRTYSSAALLLLGFVMIVTALAMGLVGRSEHNGVLEKTEIDLNELNKSHEQEMSRLKELHDQEIQDIRNNISVSLTDSKKKMEEFTQIIKTMKEKLSDADNKLKDTMNATHLKFDTRVTNLENILEGCKIRKDSDNKCHIV